MVRSWGLPQGMAASEKRPLPVTSGMQHDSVRLGDTPPEDPKQSDVSSTPRVVPPRAAVLPWTVRLVTVIVRHAWRSAEFRRERVWEPGLGAANPLAPAASHELVPGRWGGPFALFCYFLKNFNRPEKFQEQ